MHMGRSQVRFYNSLIIWTRLSWTLLDSTNLFYWQYIIGSQGRITNSIWFNQRRSISGKLWQSKRIFLLNTTFTEGPLSILSCCQQGKCAETQGTGSTQEEGTSRNWEDDNERLEWNIFWEFFTFLISVSPHWHRKLDRHSVAAEAVMQELFIIVFTHIV